MKTDGRTNKLIELIVVVLTAIKQKIKLRRYIASIDVKAVISEKRYMTLLRHFDD